MAATVAFTDLGSLAGAGFPKISDLADQQLYLEPEISSECCFEGIIVRSVALQKVLEQVAIVAPTDATVLLHGETGLRRDTKDHEETRRPLLPLIQLLRVRNHVSALATNWIPFLCPTVSVGIGQYQESRDSCPRGP